MKNKWILRKFVVKGSSRGKMKTKRSLINPTHYFRHVSGIDAKSKMSDWQLKIKQLLHSLTGQRKEPFGTARRHAETNVESEYLEEPHSRVCQVKIYSLIHLWIWKLNCVTTARFWNVVCNTPWLLQTAQLTLRVRTLENEFSTDLLLSRKQAIVCEHDTS